MQGIEKWKKEGEEAEGPVETNPDDDGNRATLSVAGVPGAFSFTYQYTQRQQLRHINRGGSPYVEFSHDENGNLTKRQHMAQGQGHDATRFQYDDLNRVTLCEQTGHNNQLFARSNYNDYDLVNNLKSISREEDGNRGEMFEYDDANQLQSVSYGVEVAPGAPEEGGGVGVVAAVGKDEEREAVAALEADPDREPLAFLAAEPEPEAAVGPRTVTYTNDAINRLSMHVGATGQTTSYTPNLLNQYTAVTGQAAPGYDGNFNLSGYDGWTYVYDAEKRLTSASMGIHSAQFVYDGLGRCVKRTIDGAATVFTYDEWKPIVEWKGDGAFVAWNLYGPGPDEILVRYQPNTGGHVHYHLDARGNVQFLLSGELHLGLEKYTYDAFGKPKITGWHGNVRPISLYGNRFLFTGREYLYTLGIYDYRHRHYHPGLGRFVQIDPLGLQIEGAKLSAQQMALYPAGTAPETFSSSELNLYRYCHNDPVNRYDPFGLDFSPYTGLPIPVDTIGGGAGLGLTVPDIRVVPVSGGDGTFTLRLDVKIIKIYVAQRAHFKSKTELKVRSEEEKKVTFEEHEKQEHGKDWKGFHDEKQREVPTTRYNDPDAAGKAAKTLTEKLKSEAWKANNEFNKHLPEDRWKDIND